MANETIKFNQEKFNQLVNDVAMIEKHILFCKKDDEGELSDWAKRELAEARKIPDEELISMEEIEKEFL